MTENQIGSSWPEQGHHTRNDKGRNLLRLRPLY
jgi:hypothetical protein